MKRRLSILLVICLLLSGCQTPVQTTVPTTQTASVPLLDQGTPLEESPNLLYIPCESLEQMMSPELHMLGQALLLTEIDGNSMVMRLISLIDGSVTAEAAIPAAPGTKLFVANGRIGLCDGMSGQVTILDDHLGIVKTYPVDAAGDDWYLSPNLDTLYIFTADRGLLSVELETGKEHWILDNGFRVFCKGGGEDTLIFSFVDRNDQRAYNRCLNLSTGALEPVPVEGAIMAGSRQGSTWLLQSADTDGGYTLICDDAASSVGWTDSPVTLLPARMELMLTDPSGRNMILCGTDGSFHSACALPQGSETFVASDLLWSEYWGGYFFADFVGSHCRLMFWDVQSKTEGEPLELSPVVDLQPPEPILEPRLYERAEELSRRFGVEICIGEQCALEYSHYKSYLLSDPQSVSSALDILEQTLGQYPEDFFRQLCYDSIETIRFELVGGLSIRNGGMIHPTTASGFAQKQGRAYIIVLDGFMLQEQTLYHEIAHIISARLEWDSLIREDALYSEDAWLALQPEGFSYAMVYDNFPQEYMEYLDSGYFVSDYSMSFPAEDRSELMEAAMYLEYWLFEPGTGRYEKMQYFADCIRDCFDISSWPETLPWERVLK